MPSVLNAQNLSYHCFLPGPLILKMFITTTFIILTSKKIKQRATFINITFLQKSPKWLCLSTGRQYVVHNTTIKTRKSIPLWAPSILVCIQGQMQKSAFMWKSHLLPYTSLSWHQIISKMSGYYMYMYAQEHKMLQ